MQADGSCSAYVAYNVIQQAGGPCCVAKAASYVIGANRLQHEGAGSKVGKNSVKQLPQAMVQSWSQGISRGFTVQDLQRSKGVYNWRPVSAAVRSAMRPYAYCANVCTKVPLAGRSTMSVQRELRTKLAESLATGKREKAFAKECAWADVPRVDELERLMASFPNKECIDWEAEPVKSGLCIAAWKRGHAKHCSRCDETLVSNDCYFKLLSHFLECGFDPPVIPGHEVWRGALDGHRRRAYVDKWREEQSRCERAFAKWMMDASGLMSDVTAELPAFFSPLLPVVREKDRWRHARSGTDYKVRLCLDLKCSGYNASLAEWPFRFWGLDCVAENVKRGDWLASLDISRFYLRLPAGAALRRAQWFQEPSSYASSTLDNDSQSESCLRFRQLLSVAFGLKSAPAYASAVSMEAVRILRAYGVQVVGVYIDDILIRGATKEECANSMRLACKLLRELGIPTNEKAQGPCSPRDGIIFLGMKLRSSDCSMTVTDEYKAYAMDRLREVLADGKASLRQMESIAGILAWISYVFLPGKPRRNVVYRVIARMKECNMVRIDVDGPLKQQLLWWLTALRKRVGASSFFWDRQPTIPLMVSDASGDDGWGVCVLGLHIVGPWPPGWEQSSGSDLAPSMLWKELVGPSMAILLLARWVPGLVFASAGDNAGGAFVLNSLSCNCPRVLELLRPVTDAMERYHLGVLGGHAHRTCNQHADILSHALTSSLWRDVVAQEAVRKRGRLELSFVVADTVTGEAFAGTMSFRQVTARDAKLAAR